MRRATAFALVVLTLASAGCVPSSLEELGPLPCNQEDACGVGWYCNPSHQCEAVQRAAAGNLNRARSGQQALLMPDGRVLLVGGDSSGTAEIYDPQKGTFTPTGSTVDHRPQPAAVLLQGGKVLVGGSVCIGQLEVFDPATNEFTRTTSNYAADCGAKLAALKDGRALTCSEYASEKCTLYDPSSDKPPAFTPVPLQNTESRIYAATTLDDGRVLLLLTGREALLYDPVANTFTQAGSQRASHHRGTPLRLQDGRIFVTSDGQPEVFDPALGTFPEDAAPDTTTLPDGYFGTVMKTGACSSAPARTSRSTTPRPATSRASPTSPTA